MRTDAFRTAIGKRSDAVLRTAIGERSDAVLRTAMPVHDVVTATRRSNDFGLETDTRTIYMRRSRWMNPRPFLVKAFVTNAA